MATCENDHRYSETLFEDIPYDQGGSGRHKCAGCAYDRGRAQGLLRLEAIALDLDTLPESQAGNARHRSPHAAWARGYVEGVRESYRN